MVLREPSGSYGAAVRAQANALRARDQVFFYTP
jgi:hypothetical protein